jgi:hypothetical protein
MRTPVALRTIAALLVLLGTAASGERWRSELYPADWTPAFTAQDGSFLHDFSYAGYRGGEWPPPRPTRRFTVVADATGKQDATGGFRKAIEAAAKHGRAEVRVPAGTFRIDGSLEITARGTVMRGEGASKTRLWFTRDRNRQGSAHFVLRGRVRRKGEWALAEDGANRAMTVRLKNSTGLAAGQQIAIGFVITDAFRKQHGMERFWKFSANKWRPFFRRTIVSLDGNVVRLDVPLRYPALVRNGASLRLEEGHLRDCGIEDLAIANASSPDAAWADRQVAAIELSDCVDCWVSGVESFASPNPTAGRRHLLSSGIRVRGSKRVTIARCRMANPQHRGGGGNGYLFEIRASNEVLVRNCEAEAGRHNFIQNWDFGTNGCVFLRIHSSGSRAFLGRRDPIGFPAASEYHHALATACLVDDSVIDDGFFANNRGGYSSGAGHAATQCVFWNVRGTGTIRSLQFGRGYVIGTGPNLTAQTDLRDPRGLGTAPADWTEGLGKAASLDPKSLYEDQRDRRLKRGAR